MKNSPFIHFLTLPLLVSLGGCVPQTFENRVTALESSMQDVRGLAADQSSQIAYLQEELRKLTGKTEEIEYTQSTKLGSDLDTLKQDLSSLKRRVPPPALVPLIPLQEDESLAERAGSSELSAILLSLREGRYGQALTALQSLQASNSMSELAPAILFWTAVSYDGLSEYKNALATYNDFIKDYPSNRRAPLCLLRQASLFEKLGDGPIARVALQKLVQDYPNSPEAVEVKAKYFKEEKAPPVKNAPPKTAPVVKKKSK